MKRERTPTRPAELVGARLLVAVELPVEGAPARRVVVVDEAPEKAEPHPDRRSAPARPRPVRDTSSSSARRRRGRAAANPRAPAEVERVSERSTNRAPPACSSRSRSSCATSTSSGSTNAPAAARAPSGVLGTTAAVRRRTTSGCRGRGCATARNTRPYPRHARRRPHARPAPASGRSTVPDRRQHGYRPRPGRREYPLSMAMSTSSDPDSRPRCTRVRPASASGRGRAGERRASVLARP